MSDPVINFSFPNVATIFTGGGGGGGGVTDHGALTGLGDDDHTHYHNNARGDARYSSLGHTHTTLATLDITTLRIAIGDGRFIRLVPVVVGGKPLLDFALDAS